jgi:hypothetical protein
LKKLILLICLACLCFTGSTSAQDWNFIKEKDGIKIFTRNSEDNPVKSYKGEATLNTSMGKISMVIGRIESFEWWDDNISEINVLEYQEEVVIKYYLVYDVPWPLDDRDLCVESKITNDPKTGVRTVYAVPMPGVIPEKPGMVRITNYWQKWVMEPMENGKVHVVLEGSVDPGGVIPSWIVNMAITDTPLNIIRKVREKVE